MRGPKKRPLFWQLRNVEGFFLYILIVNTNQSWGGEGGSSMWTAFWWKPDTIFNISLPQVEVTEMHSGSFGGKEVHLFHEKKTPMFFIPKSMFFSKIFFNWKDGWMFVSWQQLYVYSTTDEQIGIDQKAIFCFEWQKSPVLTEKKASPFWVVPDLSNVIMDLQCFLSRKSTIIAVHFGPSEKFRPKLMVVKKVFKVNLKTNKTISWKVIVTKKELSRNLFTMCFWCYFSFDQRSQGTLWEWQTRWPKNQLKRSIFFLSKIYYN